LGLQGEIQKRDFKNDILKGNFESDFEFRSMKGIFGMVISNFGLRRGNGVESFKEKFGIEILNS
jgi:hypothetical protein